MNAGIAVSSYSFAEKDVLYPQSGSFANVIGYTRVVAPI
jgi:hypothetical protein